MLLAQTSERSEPVNNRYKDKHSIMAWEKEVRNVYIPINMAIYLLNPDA